MPHFSFVNKIRGLPDDPFISSVNNDIDQLNILIDQYNRTIDPIEQIEALKKVYYFKQQIENKQSDENISKSLDYRNEIQNKLFVRLQNQFKKHGIHSLYQLSVSTTDPIPSYSLPVILVNMHPDKLSKLLAILSEGATFDAIEITNLYEHTEPGFDDYQHFLHDNNIEFLGGSNSKNFKVTPKNGSPPFVLKVDNRLGMPKWVDTYLRMHSLKGTLTSIFAERNASCYVHGAVTTRTISITEYIGGGNLESHGKKQHDNPVNHLKYALSIYTQMAIIIMGISRDQCAFPDMKNTNWLMGPNGLIRIADSKSMVPIESDGTLNPIANQKKGLYLSATSFMNPPEIGSSNSFSSDKMHSFMLGKNLYQYLSGCDTLYLHHKDSAAYYDFTAPIFNTYEGQKLQKLIKALIQPNPENRITIAQSIFELEKIQCITLLDEISSFNIGEKNVEKTQYVLAQQIQVDSANTIEEIYRIKQSINNNLEEEKKYVLSLEKSQCNMLLSEIFSYDLNKENLEKMRFVQAQQVLISASNSLEDIYIIKQNITHTLNDVRKLVLEMEKKQCLALISIASHYSPITDSFVADEQAKIMNATSFEQIEIIKQQLFRRNAGIMFFGSNIEKPLKAQEIDDIMMEQEETDIVIR